MIKNLKKKAISVINLDELKHFKISKNIKYSIDWNKKKGYSEN